MMVNLIHVHATTWKSSMKAGDLIQVTGWSTPSLFIKWSKPSVVYAVLLHNGEIREAHIDYMVRLREKGDK